LFVTVSMSVRTCIVCSVQYRPSQLHYMILRSNKSPTRCNNFPVYYPDVYLQLNMFRAFSCPSSGAQWLQWQHLVLPSYRGDGRDVLVVGPTGRPDQQPSTKVKPEAATAVIVLLMMGGKTPETCWAVNKRQNNKLEICCIWLVIYLNSTIMHGLTNLKGITCLVISVACDCVVGCWFYTCSAW
jgi:hypothetical protein